MKLPVILPVEPQCRGEKGTVALAAPLLKFPHIVLASNEIIQLIPAGTGRRLVRRRYRDGDAECVLWPQRWRPWRLGHRWRLTVRPEDAERLRRYHGPAYLRIMNTSELDEWDAVLQALEIRVSGVRVL